MQSYRWNSIPPSCRKLPEDSPSFSSSLLDSVYRSIDDEMKKKKQINSIRGKTIRSANEEDDLMQKWMEKKVEEFPSLHSCSTSSASSSAGGFSSSEAESFRGIGNVLKPVRTSVNPDHPRVSKKEEGFIKHKSMPETIKKVKQPISPGARLASFLNSLFTKHKHASSGKISSSNGDQVASSSSRSCLSKSRLNASSEKRSVRFYPISIILDEDSRPCGRKNMQEHKSRSTNRVDDRIAKNSRRVEKLAKKICLNQSDRRSKQEDDIDCASCSSSDLFELESLSVVGVDRYQDLPVYETTRLDSNRALANRMIL